MAAFLSGRTCFEWRLLGRACVTMTAFTIAIHALPFQWWRGFDPGSARSSPDEPGRLDPSPDQIVRAVNGASWLVPGGGNCLVRALTGRAMLARCGQTSELKLGVAKDARGRLRSHAWLQWRGGILIGEGAARDHAALPDLRGRL